MRDPIAKRIPREIKSDIGKQLVIFLFFVLIISAASGYFIAGDSLINSYNESFEKYNVEDGNFELFEKADDAAVRDIEKDGGITLYENFYKQEDTKGFESKLRIFGERDEINRVCLLSGDMPSADDEIAIDRLYAQNHDLKKGSRIKLDGKQLKVSGMVAFSDYSTLYENASDLMFDNDKFGIGIMTNEGFESISDRHLHYVYSWKYDKKPADDAEAKKAAEQLVKDISKHAVLTDLIPAYTNQAIRFAGDDMTDDMAGMQAFIYITIAILAFITAITTDNTMIEESGVIGTLRASGYTRGELLRHYLAVPLITLTAAAIVGNVIGYTVMEKYMAMAYLGSYSLTSYEVRFNPDALIKTTIVPFAIMFVINLVTIWNKLRFSPLNFLRRDLSRRKKKKSFRLNTKIPIMTRFRLRIIFQNLPNYITIIAGSFLANFILMFGMIFKPMLLSFQDTISDNMLCSYIYIMKAPAETSCDSAEKGYLTNLETTYEQYKHEQVSIYGIEKDSRYVNIPHDGSGVYLSTAYRDKYDLDEGGSITLKEKFTDKEYTFKISGFYDYPATIAVFMDSEAFEKTFDEDSRLQIYLSNKELTDIDEKLIASKISETDLTKTSRQLMRSMSSIMNVFMVFGIIMFVIVVYLLAKIIIERNARSISMTKILGYTEREISGLYVHSTTFVAVLSIICTIPLANKILETVFKKIFMDYSGYFAYIVPVSTLIATCIIGIVSYLAVSLLLNAKVRRVDLAEALKNVE